MIDRRHEKKKSDGSNTLKIKRRESEEMESNNQFQNSDRFNSNHSQIKHSLDVSDKSSFPYLQNPLLSQDSISDRVDDSNRNAQQEFKIKLDYEQPIPLIQLIEHEIRQRCRPDLVKQTKCYGDASEQIMVTVKSTAEIDVDQDILNKYQKYYIRNYKTDPYYIKLQELHGHQRIKHELQNYNDPYVLLNLRKMIVYISFIIPIIAKSIIKSIAFRLFMTILILFTITLFAIVKTYHRHDTDQIEQIIAILFFTEIGLRIISQGLLFSKNAYFVNFSNIFDFSIALLSAINLYRPDIVIIDLSPLRIITLLQYLGDIFDGLKVMLTALKQSIRYILEALSIVGLFSLFFALAGVFLFQGLFNYRCVPINEELGDDWIQCNVDQCPEGMECKYVEQTIKMPTSFNNIIYSYGQILRTITMDDWSWVMFFTIRIFNPWVWIFYLLIIFVCGFFSFNLVIAVLKTHYAEATEQFFHQQEQQQINKRLLEEKSNQQRDVTDVFDVAMLRQIGFLKTFKKYYHLLNQSKKINQYKLEDFQIKNSTQPRLLSAKQRLSKNVNSNYFDQFYEYLRNLTFKNILLSKFQCLSKKQKEINLKNYTDNEDYLKILEDLTKFEFSQLSKQVNPKQYQKYTSLEEVLPSFADIQNSKQNIDEKVINYTKYRCQLEYMVPKYSKNNSQIFRFKNSSSRLKCPIKKSQRANNIKRVFQVAEAQDSHAVQTTSIPNERKTYKGFNKQMIASKHSIPFTIKKGNVTYLFVQGYYLSFDKIAFKMKQKIEKEKTHSVSYDLEYKNMRMKEIKSRRVVDNNWSGCDVIETRYATFRLVNVLGTLNKIDFVVWIKGLSGMLQILRKYINRVVSSKFTEIALDLLIFINFTFLALYGIADASIISDVEDIITILLSIETFLRFCSTSFKELSNNNESILQTLIVILNFIEYTMSDYMTDLTEQNLRLIRGTKCLLFYRCLKYNSMAVTIGHIASETFKSYIYLTFLMFIVIFLYALVGMEVYAGEFDQNDLLGQLHSYDNVLKSFMTVFNIMTNDDWYGVFVLGTGINETFGTVYSYSMVIVLNYLTYGLVLAILLDGFSKYLDRQIFSEIEETEQQSLVKSSNSQQLDTSNSQQLQEANPVVQIQQKDKTRIRRGKQKTALIQHLINSIRQINQKILDASPELYVGIKCEQSLFIFNKSNHFRMMCMMIARSKLYNWINDVSLSASIIIFILQTYNDYEEGKQTYPQEVQFYLNIILAVEYLVNVIGKGLFIEMGSHFNSIWQIVDIFYLLSFFIQYQKDYYVKPIFQILLYFGYFRPFNLLNRIKFLNVLSSALYQSLVDILNVLLTLFSVWIIFGVYGIILYEGQFGFCEDKMEFRIKYEECIQENRTWINFKHNFDNITMAIPTLFTVSTFDGWGEMLQIAENSDSRNVGPVPFNSYIHTYVFFITFCFIGSMFFLSLFTGVLFSNLKANQRKIEQGEFNQNQKEFIEISEIITKDIPVFSTPPDNVIRRLASIIMNNSIMQSFFFLILFLDVVNNALFHSSMNVKYLDTINYIHHAFTIFITIWSLLQYLALGLFRFFDNHWRQFLFILNLIAVCDLAMDLKYNWVEIYYYSSPLTEYYKLYRFCFALRSFRLILIFQGLINIQRLMRVMVYALPFLGKIFFILIDTMLVFALFGCQLYGQIDSGQVMDDQINFHNIAQAMLTLFKCASGDDWRTIMTDTMHHNPNCSTDSTYCGSIYSQIYFFLFMLLSNYVFLNLFVLGLIEQFESFFQVQNSIIQTYVENEDRIKTIWCKYSPETQGKAMHYKFLCRFLMDLGSPLGRGKQENLWDAAKQASAFKLKCDHHGYIQYNQLIYELFRTCFQDDVFKTGSQNAIKQIQQYNKEMQMKLMNYRRNLFIKRANICLVDLRTNFNILHDYLNVLISFKAWESHSKNLIKKINKRNKEFTENTEFDEQNQEELQRSGHSFLNEISVFRGSVQISDTERFQPVITDDNQSKHLLTFQSQEIMQLPEIPQYDNQLESHLNNALFIYNPQK